MIDSLATLLSGVVDYAGLFPPAALAMAPAVQAYAEYLDDPHHAMLGRFVVPIARLNEFDVASRALLPHGTRTAPWTLSALTGNDPIADIDLALEFNRQHAANAGQGRAVIDSLEIKATSPDHINAVMQHMPKKFRAFFELPSDADPALYIAEIKSTNSGAKIRTGGITTNAFPSTEEVLRFIVECRDRGVAFKATAGLHHPIRAKYRLTYDENPPMGTMYGYLNLFVAALLAWSHTQTFVIAQALEETDITAFAFTTRGLTYRDVTIPLTTIRKARKAFILSFGSCSFREPVDDLAALGLL